MGVLDLASFRQDHACLFRIAPGRIAIIFLGSTSLADFHQESLDHIFLHAARLPEYALRMNVNMEMAGLDNAPGTGLFLRFAFGGLTVGQAWFRSSLGKRPLTAAIGMDQQKLDMGIHSPVADGRDLQRQRKPRDPR